MRRVIPITEQYQHFVEDLRGSFWADVHSQVRRFCNEALERESMRLREVYLNCERYERSANRRDQRNGFYFRDFQTVFGCLRLKIARSRNRSFLPAVVGLFQRRSAEVTLLVREAFLRGVSTRQVGRVITSLQLGPLSAQTVSHLSRHLDSLVAAFHQSRIADEWAYLFLDGVSLRVRRPAGRKRVHMLVAYGVRRDGSRQLLAFLRSQGESQAAWEGLLQDLYRRGLTGEQLQLIVTDGCPGLAAAMQTVYPRVLHQRCWVHKMRKILVRVWRGFPRFLHFSKTLAGNLSHHGPQTGAGSAQPALFLSLPRAPVEETTHHQRHRTLLRRSPPQNPAHGLLRQRSLRRTHHLRHLPPLQRAVAKPHPPPFYTSRLTSPLLYTT